MVWTRRQVLAAVRPKSQNQKKSSINKGSPTDWSAVEQSDEIMNKETRIKRRRKEFVLSLLHY